MAFPADYTLLGDLEFPSVTGSHSNLVALIKYDDFTPAMLASIDDGGGDLRFSSDAAGAGQLPCEVVEFDKIGNSVQVWVKSPTAATGQKLYVWGGNSGDTQPAVTDAYGRNAVWSDYEFATHDFFTDVTGNSTPAVTGVSVGTKNPPTGGPSGDFGNRDNRGQLTTAINSLSEYTLTAWARPTTNSGIGLDLIVMNSGSNNSYLLMDNSPNDIGLYNTADSWLRSGRQTLFNTWQFCVGTVGGGNRSISVDGSVYATGVISPEASRTDLYVGARSGFSSHWYFAGEMAEIRVKKSDQAESFTATEYQNQSATGAYFIASDVPSGGNTSIINVTAKKPTVLIQASATIPQPDAVAAVTAKKPTVLINASATTPSTTANISITAKKPAVNIDAQVITQLPNANVSITAKKPTVSITGSVTIPAPVSSITVTAKKPVVMIRAINNSSAWSTKGSPQTDWNKKTTVGTIWNKLN